MYILGNIASSLNNAANNQIGLNNKLAALNQKLQGESFDEVQSPVEDEKSNHLAPVTKVPTAPANLKTTGAIIPITNISSSSAIPSASALTVNAGGAGLLHVDTLNGLADALQKVDIFLLQFAYLLRYEIIL